MFIIHTRVASCLFPREVTHRSDVTEGVSGHAADFLLFSKRRATGPSYGKFIHMPHLRALRAVVLLVVLLLKSRKSAACPETPSVTLSILIKAHRSC